jgi:hypothetical protein
MTPMKRSDVVRLNLPAPPPPPPSYAGGDGGENAEDKAAPGGGWRSCDVAGRRMASTRASGGRNVRWRWGHVVDGGARAMEASGERGEVRRGRGGKWGGVRVTTAIVMEKQMKRKPGRRDEDVPGESDVGTSRRDWGGGGH